MVVLQESPHLSKQRQVVDLDLRQLFQRDARAAVEFLVEIHDGLGRLDCAARRRWVCRRPAGADRPPTPVLLPDARTPKTSRFAGLVQREHDGVLRPLGRAFQLAALHVVERDRPSVIVLAHPEPGEIRDVCRAQEAAQLEAAPP